MLPPQRIRLSRRKGFDLQKMSHALNGLDAVKVTRPGRWGNPFRISAVKIEAHKTIYEVSGDPERRRFRDEKAAHDEAVVLFAAWLNAPEQAEHLAQARHALAGKNIACWCGADESCHGDVYLRLFHS